MALFGNTDLDFYGQWGAGLFGGGVGTWQPWQARGASPYVGYSSYAPVSSMPATAAGFLRQQVPELAGLGNLSGLLGGDIGGLYSEFMGGEGAYDPTAQRSFAQGLLGRQDIQDLIRRSELETEAPIVQGTTGAESLEDVVNRLLGQEGSAVQKLYSSFGAGAAAQDIRNLLTGQQSAIGGLESTRQFGGVAGMEEGRQLADPMRYALASQLLSGAGPVDIGGGRAFNPYSAGILSDEIGLGSLDLTGHNMLEFGTGMLATQNLDLTQQIGQYFAQARDIGGPIYGAGGYGGMGGYLLTAHLADLGKNLQEGQTVSQQGQLSQWIDQLYAGRAGRNFAFGIQNYMPVSGAYQR